MFADDLENGQLTIPTNKILIDICATCYHDRMAVDWSANKLANKEKICVGKREENVPSLK